MRISLKEYSLLGHKIINPESDHVGKQTILMRARLNACDVNVFWLWNKNSENKHESD